MVTAHCLDNRASYRVALAWAQVRQLQDKTIIAASCADQNC
jgi:hypothetical protein